MKKKFKYFLYHTVFPYTGVYLVRLLSSTYRLRLVDLDNEKACIEKDGSIIYASWHQRFFPGATFFATRKPIAILVSRSRDGEFAARVVDILGWCPVRGSSTKGGHEGLEQLKELSRKGYRIGHIVDGPKGPFGEIKPGLLRIAQVSGLAIVPTITSSEKRWTMKSWDSFMIPKPFSRVLIRFGKAIYVSPELSDEGFEEKRREIAQKMREIYVDTDRIWKDRERLRGIFS